MRWLLLIVLFLAALTTLPVLAEVKNVDNRISEVQAIEGRGRSVEDALRCAKVSAVEKVVKEVFDEMDEGPRPYREVADSIPKELSTFGSDLKMTDKYREGDFVVVAVSGKVAKEALKQRLLELGVVRELTDAIAKDQLPRIVVGAASDSHNLATQVAVRTINHTLTDRHLAIVDDDQIRKLKQDDHTITNSTKQVPIRSDLIATDAPADIELVASSEVRPTQAYGALQLFQAQVEITARIPGLGEPFSSEVYTSRELGFKLTDDRIKSQEACIEEAIGGAIKPLIKRVYQELRDERAVGKMVSVTVFGNGPALDRAGAILTERLKTLTVDAREGVVIFKGRVTGKFEDLVELIGNDPHLEIEGEPKQNIRSASVHVRLRQPLNKMNCPKESPNVQGEEAITLPVPENSSTAQQ